EYGGRFLLVSNLPYNVASSVMLNLVAGSVAVDDMHITVQKEVAERMTAEPGCKEYGPLSIFLAATGQAKTIKMLSPDVVWPRPQVESAMISFRRTEEKAERIKNIQIFSEVVAVFMQHRRKMLKACTKFASGRLKAVKDWQQIFEQCSINPQNRPEQLSAEDYIAISNLCCGQLKADK
ncbi:ribosomal RNA small subunit methyltransferase A, partial [Planctomycetota bacterium]